MRTVPNGTMQWHDEDKKADTADKTTKTDKADTADKKAAKKDKE